MVRLFVLRVLVTVAGLMIGKVVGWTARLVKAEAQYKYLRGKSDGPL
jgi:hypothetical protein